MNKIGKILGDVIFVVLIVALLGSSLMFALNQDPEKTILGYRAYNVLSGSMEPALSKGDLIIVRAVPAEELQNGDIVTYYPTDEVGTTVTHRVINTLMKEGQIFIETKGDAVEQSDPMISGDAIIGVVVFHIPLLGGVISLIQNHLIVSIAVVVLAVAAWIAGGYFVKKSPKKTEPQDQAPQGRDC